MYTIETGHFRLTSLPLPLAALVIDTRDHADDDVIQRLRVEITDLASDMIAQNIHHWRHLKDFLSFQEWQPLQVDEVALLRPNAAKKSSQSGPASPAQPGLTGFIDPMSSVHSFTFDDGEIASLDEHNAIDTLQQQLKKIIDEIDRIRQNRHHAVTDSEKTFAGRGRKEETVGILFLTDAKHANSLATTAICAARLKQYYSTITQHGLLPTISITVICLNNNGGDTPDPDLKELLWDDEWKHIDSLILLQEYNSVGDRIGGAVQSYLVELLLYVLLIMPTLNPTPNASAPQPSQNTSNASIAAPTTTTAQNPQTPPPTTTTPQTTPNTSPPVTVPGTRSIPLPTNTYLVGLATMERSTRWGRRLINFTLAEEAIKIVLEGTDGETDSIKSNVTTWFNKWLAEIRAAIPAQIPIQITGAQAIKNASSAIQPVSHVLPVQSLVPGNDANILAALDTYLEALLSTYAAPTTATHLQPTLQDVVASVQQIQEYIHEWASRDTDIQRDTPLIKAHLEAQRFLSHPDLFRGEHGAVPRAREQLEVLQLLASDLKRNHLQNGLNVKERARKLAEMGRQKIDALKDHHMSFPFLATKPPIRTLMSFLGVLTTFFSLTFLAFAAIALIRHAILSSSPSTTFIQQIDGTILPAHSLYPVLFWFVMILLLFLLTFFIYKAVPGQKDRSALEVELFFLCTLVAITLLGIVGLTAIHALLNGDLLGTSLIQWESIAFPLGLLAGAAACIIVFIEFPFFRTRYHQFRKERKAIVEELNKAHQENIDAIRRSVADAVALHILQKNGLLHEKEMSGDYYNRVSQLKKVLGELLISTQQQQQLTKSRLAMNSGNAQSGSKSSSQGPWLNLRVHEELLDMSVLMKSHYSLPEQLRKDTQTLRLFAEVMLRVMGEEPLDKIERNFNEQASMQGSLEKKHLQVLMTIITSLTLRLLPNINSVTSLGSLVKRYDQIADTLSQQSVATIALIENLRSQIDQTMLNSMLSTSKISTTAERSALALQALAAWTQMFWEGKDPIIDHALSNKGVLSRLLEDEDGAYMVKRQLEMRMTIFGRSYQKQTPGATYLFIPYTHLNHQFSQDLNIPKEFIKHFPDIERLVLLHIQRYEGQALLI